ncbi:uncharacterized protein LOC121735398 [Aricia agestis]|uniref:uncharacterized protein LOC121735398 n=1 Tax=Aricia agestis TaxID=91739 RepID=UPI001C2088D4|nr:uncharacterized protein LOC121735398 [Aricia agestis]
MHNAVNELAETIMARFNKVATLFVLLALLAVTWAQTPQDDAPPEWTTCDILGPKISCQDCNTRLICKPVGGLLKPCNNPYRPHCNNGICSAVPSPDCAV